MPEEEVYGGRGRCASELACFSASPGHSETQIQTVRVSLQPTASWGLSGDIPRGQLLMGSNDYVGLGSCC